MMTVITTRVYLKIGFTFIFVIPSSPLHHLLHLRHPICLIKLVRVAVQFAYDSFKGDIHNIIVHNIILHLLLTTIQQVVIFSSCPFSRGINTCIRLNKTALCIV